MHLLPILLVAALAAMAPVRADLPASLLAEATKEVEEIFSLYSATIPPAALATAAAVESALASEFVIHSEGVQANEATLSLLATNAAARATFLSEIAPLYPGLFGKLATASGESVVTSTNTAATTPMVTQTSVVTQTSMSASAMSGATSSSSHGSAATGSAAGGAFGMVGLVVAALI